MDFAKMFKGMTVDEMKASLKAIATEGKAFVKALETSAKEDLVATVKASMKEGDTVKVSYKDEVIEGKVVALRDKTFTILTDDILNIKGEASKIARGYNLVILADEEVTEEEIDEAIA
jgi:hypothetical protein